MATIFGISYTQAYFKPVKRMKIIHFRHGNFKNLIYSKEMIGSALAISDDLSPIVLKALIGTYSLINLPRDAEIPEWAKRNNPEGLLSFTQSYYGFSIICPDAWVPNDIVAERVPEWRVFRVDQPRGWAMYGLYSRLTQPLADDAISIYIVGSYDADHILLRQPDFARAKQILSRFCEIV